MLTRPWYHAIALGLAPLLVYSLGCLKRTERIQISADGAVKIAIDYEGEKGDFETLDALPSAASGWKLKREVSPKEGKEEISLRGERTFAPREDLPSTFAAPDDPNAALVLQFPTTLVREKRSDGVYLHFRRVYKPRDWAYVDFWSKTGLDDNVKKLGEKKPEELTHDERLQLIKAFAGVESMKQVEFAGRAFKDIDANARQDHFLLARKAILEVYEDQTDWDALAKRLEALSGDDRDKEVERTAQLVLDQARKTMIQSLRTQAKFDDDRMTKFEAAFDRAKRYYDITAQQEAHAFEIRVSMPGEIVAHNADKDEDGEFIWEFDGSAFRDRPYELMVTSKLPLSREDKD